MAKKAEMNGMSNPVVIRCGRYFNLATGRFLSEKYGKRLFNFHKRNPSCSLKAARGHKERVHPAEAHIADLKDVHEPKIVYMPNDHSRSGGPKGQNLKIWSKKELKKSGYL